MCSLNFNRSRVMNFSFEAKNFRSLLERAIEGGIEASPLAQDAESSPDRLLAAMVQAIDVMERAGADILAESSENGVEEKDISQIGDYVLTGGEIPAMVITDSVVRLLPGVLEEEAVRKESFSQTTVDSLQSTVLDYPTYTRPEDFKGWKVPGVLLSGHHAEIEKWRKDKSLEATKKKRPDLLKNSS